MDEILNLLNDVYDLHTELAKLGWIANDFYDRLHDLRLRPAQSPRR